MPDLVIEQIQMSLEPEIIDAMTARLQAGGVSDGRCSLEPVKDETTLCRLIWHSQDEAPVTVIVERSSLNDEHDGKAVADRFLKKWRGRNPL